MRYPVQPGNGRRRHRRRDHKHHDADYFTTGPKRTGPIGTITPGDHEEVARDIQRLWDYVRRRKCCDSTPKKDGLSQWQTDGYIGRLQHLGVTGLWRLGESGAPWSAPTGFFKDTSGVTSPVDLSYTDPANPAQRPTLDVASLIADDTDGALQLNFDRLNGRTTAAGGVEGGASLVGGVPGLSQPNYAFGSGKVLTASCWFNPSQSGGTGADEAVWPYWAVIFGGYGSYGADAIYSWTFEVEQYTGACRFRIFDPVLGTDSISLPTNLAFAQKIHAVVTFDPSDGRYRFYINGTLVTSKASAVTHTLDVSTIRVGSGPIRAGLIDYIANFYGTVDECSIYGRTLTPSEVASLYNATDTTGWVSGEVGGSDILNGSLTPEKFEPTDPNVVLGTDSSGVPLWTKVKTAMIDALAVTTAAIADLAVTTIKLADLAVTTAKLADAAVSTIKIADNAVTNAKIAVGGVNADRLVGYPADSSKALLGDGSWGAAGGGSTNLEALWAGSVPAAALNLQVWRVPFVGGVSKTFNLSRASFRLETPSSLGSVQIIIEKSAGGGVFTAVALVTLTLAVGAYEVTDTASLSGKSVTSGDLVRARFVSVGSGATDFTIQLEGNV